MKTAHVGEVGNHMTKTPFILIGVVLISFTVTFVALYAFVIQPFVLADGDFQNPTPMPTMTMAPTVKPSLSPARNLIGTWETSAATNFYIRTDFATGEMQNVGSEDRTMTWIITAGDNENTLNIEVHFTGSNRQLSDQSGYTPDVSPMFFTGTISGSRLTLTGSDGTIGQFNFTTDNIKGTWNDQWTGVYSQQVYTATDGLILTR
jgi:hypothetical protein